MPPVLVLSRRDVESLLDLDQLVDAVAAAMADLSAGHASMPPRGAAMVADRHAFLASMPAFLPSSGALTTKLVSLFPENTDRPTHQAIVCVFDPDNGTPLALLDGTHITAARTAAGSALASRLLARKNARVVAIIGTGVQARSHARALVHALPVEQLRIAGRDLGKAQAMARELSDHLQRPVDAAPSIEDAVRSADIVCAVTHADQPVVRREWLSPGTHINSVGYNTSGGGEVDTATVRDALVVVESRASALAPPPSGAVELRLAIERGEFSPEQIHAELGELVAGDAKGRSDDSQLTLYKSVGVAVQDAAAAALVLRVAHERGAGTQVAL